MCRRASGTARRRESSPNGGSALLRCASGEREELSNRRRLGVRTPKRDSGGVLQVKTRDFCRLVGSLCEDTASGIHKTTLSELLFAASSSNSAALGFFRLAFPRRDEQNFPRGLALLQTETLTHASFEPKPCTSCRLLFPHTREAISRAPTRRSTSFFSPLPSARSALGHRKSSNHPHSRVLEPAQIARSR